MFLNPWFTSAVTGSASLTRSRTSSPAALPKENLEQSTVVPETTAGYEIHSTADGRLFYYDQGSQSTSWVPPASEWTDFSIGFPYGWEPALDKNGKEYYINHLAKRTTYDDPRKSIEEFAKPRDVVLDRHEALGFGFVAGSEKPVIVRFVTEGGPSEEKLLPEDQIWMINGEDVRKAPREHVIQLVRSCKDTVRLTVCQPPLDNSARKSAILSAAKKARLKTNPSRVRFAEGVLINGSSISHGPQFEQENNDNGLVGPDSCLPLIPNALKVFLENGQTKSFKYDGSTTVRDVLESLQQKLTVRCIHHFALVVEHAKSIRKNKLTLLDPDDTLCKVASQPGAHNLRCLFRVAFVPKDACELLKADPVAFDYLYIQCCNDVVHERFAPELKYEIALRLAALHIHQHALSNNMSGKFSMKCIEKEFGLERFIPSSLAESMKRKELRKLLQHFTKSNAGLVPTGQKSLTALQAKLHYLRIIGELPSYGAKCFSMNLREESVSENVLLVSPKLGICEISGAKNSVPEPLCEIENVISVEARREDALSYRVEFFLKDPERESFSVSLEERDAEELILVLQGYYSLFTDHPLKAYFEKKFASDSAPPYEGPHLVQPAPWSYLVPPKGENEVGFCKLMDLRFSPPCPPLQSSEVVSRSRLSLPNPETRWESVDGASQQKPWHLDRNMNKANLNERSSLQVPNITRPGKGLSSFTPSSPSMKKKGPFRLGFDLQSVVSMEILECNNDQTHHDSINGSLEALKRVTDMKQLVRDAETYLTDQDISDTVSLHSQTDSETSNSGSPPQTAVFHRLDDDSPYILEQDEEDQMAPKPGLVEVESDDTDSLSTPTGSPIKPPRGSMKPSDSSFGLHSPDAFSPDFNDGDFQEMVKKLKGEQGMEGTLYFDPDIIDLTFIPPPITPEEEALKSLPNQLFVRKPPVLFADMPKLEETREIPTAVITPPDLGRGEEEGWKYDELESFISMTTLPPPPDEPGGNDTDLSSLIIPPPPLSSDDDSRPTLPDPETKVTVSPRIALLQSQLKNKSSPEKVQSSSSLKDNKSGHDQEFQKGAVEGLLHKKAFAQRREMFLGNSADPSDSVVALREPFPFLDPDFLDHSLDASANYATVKAVQMDPATLTTSQQMKALFAQDEVENSPKSSPRWRGSSPAAQGDKPLYMSPSLSRKAQEKDAERVTRSPKLTRSFIRDDKPDLVLNLNGQNSNFLNYFDLPEQKHKADSLTRSVFGENSLMIPYGLMDDLIGNIVQRMEEIIGQCGKAHVAGGGIYMNPEKFKGSKEALATQARQLVGASKLFMRTITEGKEEDTSGVKDRLDACLDILEKMKEISEDLVNLTTNPLQTQNLLIRVRAVAHAFRLSLQVAAQVLEKRGEEREALHPPLMERATLLSLDLSGLLRALRVFAP